MDYILGLLTAVVFFIALIGFYTIGYKQGSKKPAVIADKEEVRKAKEHQENFLKLMNYDVHQATQKKKVT
jgi:hypothetical protein